MELRNFDVGWTRLYLALQNRDLPVLLGQCLLLIQHLLVFLLVRLLNLLQDLRLLTCLHVLLSFKCTFLLLLKSLLLFPAVLFQLHLRFC